MLKRLVPTKTSRRRAARTTLPALASLVLGLALVVLGAYSAVRPAAGQESFPEPTEIVSKDGVLQVKLTAEEQQIEMAGTPVTAQVYNGAFVGPTLRLNPGDKLELELVDSLSDPTNLHYHGTHVSPSGNSDNVLRRSRCRNDRPVRVGFPARPRPRNLLVPLARASPLGRAGLRRHVRTDRGRGADRISCPRICATSRSGPSR